MVVGVVVGGGVVFVVVFVVIVVIVVVIVVVVAKRGWCPQMLPHMVGVPKCLHCVFLMFVSKCLDYFGKYSWKQSAGLVHYK